uniref:Uncharacterized protein n=1 Tax=Rhizophora mucronata TaxID=61149 RepID=A0A2P2N7J6_RHIMU
MMLIASHNILCELMSFSPFSHVLVFVD